MEKNAQIPGTIESWESGALGLDEAHQKRVSPTTEAEIDSALGLQAISIRLPRGVIETYKLLAKFHDVGYQPLMRDAICRWAEGEMKQVLIGAVESRRQAESTEAPTSDKDFPKAA